MLIRLISWTIGVLGIATYVFFLYMMYIGWKQGEHIHISIGSEIFYIFDTAIFGSGLPPLILTIYFMFFGKTLKDFGIGISVIFISIIIHFYVSAFAAHSEAIIYIPMQVIELAAAIFLVFYWRKRNNIRLASNSNK